MGIIERILCRIFPFTDIMRDGTNDIYLRRWFVYPRNKDFKKFVPRIYLHKFYRGDEDDFLHDHPWRYTSLILTKGYWEETPAEFGGTGWYIHPETKELRTKKFYPRFSVLRRPAVWKHRVILKDTEPVWTIVKTGVKERSWGFWVDGRLCPWRTFTQGVQWCRDTLSQW